VLLREGLRRLLQEAGIEVLACVGDAKELLIEVERRQPEVAIVDIRMPPTFTNEGSVAAATLRERWPSLGILLLSQTIESTHALRMAREHPGRFGYLLKDRVLDIDFLIESVERVANGGTVLDPEIVASFLGRRTSLDRLAGLTVRERAVLDRAPDLRPAPAPRLRRRRCRSAPPRARAAGAS
jgi:DNA-binding NarL/FixJ family response regulator